MVSKIKKPQDEETLRVAANFKRLRKHMGWTLHETAQHASPPVSLAYIGHIERCNSGLGKRARKKWAKIFGVDVSEFLKPLDANSNEYDREIRLLKEEAAKYGVEKIKRLRQLMPLLLGEDSSHAGVKKRISKTQP